MNIPDKRYVPDNRQNSSKKSGGAGSGVLGLIIVAVFLLTSRTELGDTPAAFVALIALAVGFVVFAAVKSAKANAAKTNAARRSAPASARSAQARTAGRVAPRGAAEKAEEAVHCHHSTGKQKYLEQLDGFLANGIIDKAEYKLMRERYERLNIEDDYH